GVRKAGITLQANGKPESSRTDGACLRPNVPHKLTKSRRAPRPAAEPPRAALKPAAARRLQFAPSKASVSRGSRPAALLPGAEGGFLQLRVSALGRRNSRVTRNLGAQFLRTRISWADHAIGQIRYQLLDISIFRNRQYVWIACDVVKHSICTTSSL